MRSAVTAALFAVISAGCLLMQECAATHKQQIPIGKQFIKLISKTLSSSGHQPHSNQANGGGKWHSYDDIPVVFDCILRRSSRPPQSVHKLRPADVDIVAAMGDSLTAGMAALAHSLREIVTQYRGYAFSIGGDSILEDHITLPNILRRGNCRLYGDSSGTGSHDSANSSLNVAIVGCPSVHMLDQAKDLVQRMRLDPFVDLKESWKLITLFVGANDACDYCKDKSLFSVANYTANVKAALDYLHANLPRTFVNVVEATDVTLVKRLLEQNPERCSKRLLANFCPCAVFPKNEKEEVELANTIRQYQLQVRQLIASGRYDTGDDFTVVSQPYANRPEPPKIRGKYDMSYFALDCFHLSRKGHSAAGKGLWNNMLEPVGQKSDSWSPDAPLLCPTKRRPFLMTNKNSP